MAYNEQTTVATPAVLIDRIVNFAAANGWDVLRNEGTDASRVATLQKSPGTSDFIHIYNVDQTSIRMRVSPDYADGQLPDAQPGVSGECYTQLEAGPYPKAFLFADGNWVWVAVGIARSGEYRHLTFGMLDKVGEYEGGTYIDGTYWGRSGWWAYLHGNNHLPFFNLSGSSGTLGRVRADVPEDNRSNFYFAIGGNTGGTEPTDARTEAGSDTDGRASCCVIRADDNAFSGRSVFHPIPVYVARTGSQRYYSPIGVVPGMRLCSINKFEPEQEVTIGTDVYTVFPCIAKRPMNSSSGQQPGATGDYGYAIRKIL